MCGFVDLIVCGLEDRLSSFFCCSGVAVDFVIVMLFVLRLVAIVLIVDNCCPLVRVNSVHMMSSLVVSSVSVIYFLCNVPKE